MNYTETIRNEIDTQKRFTMKSKQPIDWNQNNYTEGNQNTSLQTIHNEINTITHKQLDEVFFFFLVNSVGITVIVVWALKSNYQSLPPLLSLSSRKQDKKSSGGGCGSLITPWHTPGPGQRVPRVPGGSRWALQLIANLVQEFGELFLSRVRFFWGASLILRIHKEIKTHKQLTIKSTMKILHTNNSQWNQHTIQWT